MLQKALILLASIWITVYEISYGICEYKRGNGSGMAAIVLLCLILAVVALFSVI